MKLVTGVLDKDFNNDLALFMAGYCFLKTERFGLAYNIFRRVIELNPKRSEPWNNAGNCHQETWNLDDAEKCFKMAMRIEPNNPAAMQNLALIAINRCQPDEALKWTRMAEKYGSTWEATDNKALALLMKREWREGWENYRKTAGRQKQRELRSYGNDEPMWSGEPGKVIVYSTQGLGDEIAFSSCLPDAIKKADITVECDPKLEGLFRRSFDCPVYGTRFGEAHWNTGCDYSIPIDCLPQLFRNATDEFPGTAFLKSDPERRIQWNALLKSYGKPAIGIAWTGGLNTTGKAKRSLKLEDFAGIIKSVDATWVCLEYRDRDEEIAEFEKKHGIKIHHWKRATHSKDYDDVAGLVSELDLVISVTTAVVHLSGALGVKCWCLAPSLPRWFYGLEGDLPWYKSVEMFRQTKEWPLKDIESRLKLRFA